VVLLALTVVPVALFGGTNDWLLSVHRELAEGVVASEAPLSHGLHLVYYRFRTPDGQAHRGHCYLDDAELVSSLRSGGAVNVEYVPGKPWISRIAGMRHAPSSLRESLLRLVRTAGLFAAFLTFAAVVYQRRRHLSERGVATRGEVLAPSGLDRAFNWKLITRGAWRWGRVRYRFVDAAARRHVGTMSTEGHAVSFQPGDEITVIYDPLKPRRSICIEAVGLEFIPKPDQTGSQDQQNQPIKPAPRSCCGPGR